jgi:uncharacterized protein
MKINKLALGTVQMGIAYGINNTRGKISFIDSQSILNESFSKGIRVLDTAVGYGDSHHVIGTFHEAYPDKKFEIISKISSSVDDIDKEIEEYLHELRIDYLEGLLFHSFTSYKSSGDIIRKLVDLKSRGLIKKIGVSIYTNSEFEVLLRDKEIDIIQLPFNLLDNFTLRGALLKEAKKLGKIIHTRSSFLQGLFFRNPNDELGIVRSLQRELLEINRIAQEEGLSIASLALGYCLAQITIDKVIIGVDSLEQLRSNLIDCEVELSNNAIREIDKIIVKNIHLLNPSLWN